jgi:hypothetical protein
MRDNGVRLSCAEMLFVLAISAVLVIAGWLLNVWLGIKVATEFGWLP